MSERSHQFFLSAMLATSLLMALLIASHFVQGLPTVSMILAIGIIFFEITAPFEILKRLNIAAKDCHIYAHNIDTVIDIFFPPITRGRFKPDFIGMKKEMKEFLWVSLITFGLYIPAYWGYFALNAIRQNAELVASLNWPPQFFYEVITQIFVVALPEELFYRGFLQSALARKFSHHRNFFGHASIAAVVLTNIIFALGHVASSFSPIRMLTFFPGLVFSYLVVRNQSIFSAVLFHAACNIVGQILYASFYLI